MGHGVVEYGGGMMMCSHEGIAEDIGARLAALSGRSEYKLIQQAADQWLADLDTGPGCSAIQLDDVLADQTTKSTFIAALTEIHGELPADRPRTKEQIRQVLLLLSIGESALVGPYRPVRLAQPSAPADGPAAASRRQDRG